MSNDREASAADVNKKLSKLMLEDVSQRSKLSTSSKRSSKRKIKPTPRIICMDLLNFAGSFFKCRQKTSPPWDKEVAKARKKVKKFVKAARNSNIEIISFIDKSVATERLLTSGDARGRMSFVPGGWRWSQSWACCWGPSCRSRGSMSTTPP